MFLNRFQRRTNRSLPLLSMLMTGIAAVGLAGCGGGGGGSSPAASAPTRAAISGTITAPASQTRAAANNGVQAADDPSQPVQNAHVALIDLDATDPNTSQIGTTSTDAGGNYAFPTATAGHNYKIQATKTIGSKTLTLQAIVTVPTATDTNPTPAPQQHNLDPITTVAAQTAIERRDALKRVDPSADTTNLQAIADDMAQKATDSHTPPPDCTNPQAVNNASQTLKQAAAPNGSYTGEAIVTQETSTNSGVKIKTVGDKMRLAALIDTSGKFFLTAFSENSPTTTGSGNGNNTGNNSGNGSTGNNGSGNPAGGNNGNGSTGTGNNGTTDPGNNNGGNGNGSTGSNGGSGSGNGNGSNNTGNGGGNHGGDGSDFAIGTVNSDGIVDAMTKSGKIKVTGVFTSGVGVGTWAQTDGNQSGTWSLTLLKGTYSGLYAGKHHRTDGGEDGMGKNDFALLVLDDNTLFLVAGGSDNNSAVRGTGTVDNTGHLTFTINDNGNGIITGTGTIDTTAGSLSGTYSSTSGETGSFVGRRTNPDTSDL